jgi:hypothetical protein
MIRPPRFNLADAERAADAWGCNCGPGALAAIMGLTLDDVRPHIGDFERRGYVNPTMMFDALNSVGAIWKPILASRSPAHLDFPLYGLARIQWEGPWMRPGVPIGARYARTHWVGAAHSGGEIGIFDINCINNGSGWVALREWCDVVVPFILREAVPRADGKWHITHAIEVDPPRGARAGDHGRGRIRRVAHRATQTAERDQRCSAVARARRMAWLCGTRTKAARGGATKAAKPHRSRHSGIHRRAARLHHRRCPAAAALRRSTGHRFRRRDPARRTRDGDARA